MFNNKNSIIVKSRSFEKKKKRYQIKVKEMNFNYKQVKHCFRTFHMTRKKLK